MQTRLTIVLATRNAGKTLEIRNLLQGLPVNIKNLNDFGPIPSIVEDGATFDDNAYKKASLTARYLGLPALADDSGLCVAALNGAPGVLSARYGDEQATDEGRCHKLLNELGDTAHRDAYFECVLSLAIPTGQALTYEARCHGTITKEPQGDNGFGYDPVFFYPPLNKTFARLSLTEKNQISHRGLALKEFRSEFDKVLIWIRQHLPQNEPIGCMSQTRIDPLPYPDPMTPLEEINMLKFNSGIDIVQEIGKIATPDDVRNLLSKCLDADQLKRLEPFRNPAVLLKIANAIVMCEPDHVWINTGSEADKQYIRDMALQKGEEEALPMPGHTIHFDLKEEQGRIIDRTYYVANDDELVSSLALRMGRPEALEVVRTEMVGIMRGKTMIIGFFSRGPAGAHVSNPAIEITSSAYVSHSAELLYRNIYSTFEREALRLGHFYTNIHSEGLNRSEDLPHARVLMDRSHRTTYSFKCTYAGNTLLMKKGNHRFSVDRSVYEKRGSELAEHMFITGVRGPNGRVTWVTGAAPSGCGKTTTAMAGDYFIGDDLAQMWIDEDGSIRSINPECGVFGIVEDVNQVGDPLLMKCLRQPGTEVIWTNVLVDDNGVPHWVGNGEDLPDHGRNFQGPWKRGMKDAKGKEIPLSHPNARCTLSSTALENYSPIAEDPKGAETRIVTYSGRDSDTMPPVWATRNPDQGVVIGACIVSAATATEVGAVGVKRSPWANSAFIPGSLGDYMDAQFKFFGSNKIDDAKRPVMAGLNYFLSHDARGGGGKKLLGEKRDVKAWLAWLERWTYNEVPAIQSPIGMLPRYDDLKKLFKERANKDYPRELYDKQFSLYINNIVARIDMQLKAYEKEENLPARLFEILNEERRGLIALKEKYGPIVSPQQLEADAL